MSSVLSWNFYDLIMGVAERLSDDKHEIWVFSKACDLGQIFTLGGLISPISITKDSE